MKKMVILLAVLAMIAGFSTVSFAASDIASTKHNLADDFPAVGEICKFCHVPHNPLKNATPDYPLWNHADSLQTFTLYGSHGTLDNSGGTATNVSILCLSCHDGVTNVDAFGGSTGTTAMGAIAGVDANNIVGTNLQDDHPVMVAYPGAGGATADYKSDASFTNVEIFSNNIECASCHNPHDNTVAPFLRASNANSALCLECHIK